MIWRCRDRSFDLDRRVLVMGIVNVTPDSFSDGGRTLDPGLAVAAARRHIDEGADLVDLGAESTRPGAEPVPVAEQWRRLAPVLEGLRDSGACLSIDTSSADVAERALDLGAHVVNDVRSLSDPALGNVVARSGAGLVLMHMQGSPATMQRAPHYDDVSVEVAGWLSARRERAVQTGIAEECLVLDPGIGFGKTAEHNLELIARLERVVRLGRPVMVGASRKSFLGKILDLPVDSRVEAGLGAAAVAVFLGARIVRTHDVAATVRAVTVAAALRWARDGVRETTRA